MNDILVVMFFRRFNPFAFFPTDFGVKKTRKIQEKYKKTQEDTRKDNKRQEKTIKDNKISVL